MQFVVLGMHRSGTSMMTRLLNLSGAYFGKDKESTGANLENPKGFWERRDVRNLNDYILHSLGCDWDRVSKFDINAVPKELKERFNDEGRSILARLDVSPSFVLKEPRFCLLYPLWRELLDDPICVFVSRNPIECAISLRQRNDFQLSFGLSLWEYYSIQAFKNLVGEHLIVVDHSQLLNQPHTTLFDTLNWINSVSETKLKLPSKQEISEFVDEDLYRAKTSNEELTQRYLSENQFKLRDFIKSFRFGRLPSFEMKVSQECVDELSAHERDFEKKQNKLKKIQVLSHFSAAETGEDLETVTEEGLKFRTRVIELLSKNQNLLNEINDERTSLAKLSSERSLKQKDLAEDVSILKTQISEYIENTQSVENPDTDLNTLLSKISKELIAEIRNSNERVIQLERLNQNFILELNHTRKEKDEVLLKLKGEFLEVQSMLQPLVREVAEKNYKWSQVSNENKILESRIADYESRITDYESQYSKYHSRVLEQEKKLVKKIEYLTGYSRKILKGQVERAKIDPVLTPSADAVLESISSNTGRLIKVAPSIVGLSVDVVVCVHNALEDVKVCLDSLLQYRAFDYRILIVDDGSKVETQKTLEEFASNYEFVELQRNPSALGYTVSANIGISLSVSDYVVVLNSDTIVTQRWIESLLECGESSEDIGIVGPLSNAAGYQTVPSLEGEKGGWAVHDLPLGLSLNQLADAIHLTSKRLFPRVGTVNGFCFCIKRRVLNTIGFFDENCFPMGYGEENDYCFRATEAGFELAIADHAYVFHAKSKSFTPEGRKPLNEAGKRALVAKWGQDRLQMVVSSLAKHESLAEIRDRIQLIYRLCLEGKFESKKQDLLPFSLLYILPVKGGSGGAHSVIQEANGMRSYGIQVAVACLQKHRSSIESIYPDFPADLFRFFSDFEELSAIAKDYRFACATIFTSVALLKKLQDSNPGIIPAYYIQDYEPWIVKKGSAFEDEAKKSYQLIPGCVCFAKTDWICNTVANKHGISMYKVAPSIDNTLYNLVEVSRGKTGSVTICAMIRPHTPRRGAEATMRVFKRISELHGSGVKIKIFGVDPKGSEFLKLERGFEFENLGILKRADVADLLKKSDVFVDFSTYQAFGRTALEAMACGCVALVPQRGGIDEFAIDGLNSIFVDTADEDAMFSALNDLLSNLENLERLSQESTKTAQIYSVDRSVRSILSMFNAQL